MTRLRSWLRLCCLPPVFRLFGRPKYGVTAEIFQRQVHTRLGIILTDEEAQELFAQFDIEGA